MVYQLIKKDLKNAYKIVRFKRLQNTKNIDFKPFFWYNIDINSGKDDGNGKDK